MSIASEITRLQNDSAAIASAIAAKGVTVPSGSGFDDYATLIGQISGGGGGKQPITITNLTFLSTSQRYVNANTGNVATLNAASYTRLIECEGYEEFVLNTTFYYSHLCAFYDCSVTYISGIKLSGDGSSSYTGSIPIGAKYVVFNFKTTTPPTSLTLRLQS